MACNLRRILVFEKDRDFATDIMRILQNEGCEVETAGSLLDLQHRTARHPADVLIVGKYLGFEKDMEALKGVDPSLRKVLIARWPDVSDVSLFVGGGFDDYVAFTGEKVCPFEAKNLILTIRGVGNRKDRSFQSTKKEERVLVFEEDSAKDIEKTFVEAGFGDIFRTGDVEKGLKWMEDEGPALLAADMRSPQTVQFLREVRTHSKLPVILVGESRIPPPAEDLFWYFDYFMIKPLRAKDIVSAAEFLLREENCFRLPSLKARRPDEVGVNFYFAGPYGAGKSTLARLLSDPDVIGSFKDSIPTLDPYPRYITRGLWPKEKSGVDYYFVPEATFDELLRRGKEIDWKRVDWGKKIEGIQEFYHLEGIRVSADIPLPVGRDFLIAPALKGFEKMAPDDSHGKSIFFGISFETMKKRQLDRPESDRERRTPKTLEEYGKYMARFDPYFARPTFREVSKHLVEYGLMIMNEDGSDLSAPQENELNRMRKMAVRLAWYIKYVREGLALPLLSGNP